MSHLSHFFSKTRGKNNLKKKGLFWLTALGDTTRNEREGMVSGLDGSTWVHSQEAKSSGSCVQPAHCLLRNKLSSVCVCACVCTCVCACVMCGHGGVAAGNHIGGRTGTAVKIENRPYPLCPDTNYKARDP